MTCRLDACNQGRDNCPNPGECSDEPLVDPNYMQAMTALTGVLAVVFIVGSLAWLVHAIWPVVRAAL